AAPAASWSPGRARRASCRTPARGVPVSHRPPGSRRRRTALRPSCLPRPVPGPRRRPPGRPPHRRPSLRRTRRSRRGAAGWRKRGTAAGGGCLGGSVTERRPAVATPARGRVLVAVSVGFVREVVLVVGPAVSHVGNLLVGRRDDSRGTLGDGDAGLRGPRRQL